MDWTATLLTLKLSICTTLILLVVGIPFSYWLARTNWKGRFLLDALVAMPLILPPTVLGFYLLVFTGTQSPFGKAYESVSGQLLPFTFQGILVGTVVCNIPFAIRPFVAAFKRVDQQLIEASWSLGESRFQTFRRIVFPMAWPGIFAGLVLTFAHTVGEFGVVLMVGGNIPGVTRTLSVAIYDDVQALDYRAAGQTALVLVVFAFIVLSITYLLERRRAE